MQFFKKYISILLLAFSAVTAASQVKVDVANFDFGILQNWSETPAVFTLTNTSNDPMAILNIRKSINVHVNYPRQFIDPGATARIFVYFEPPDIGKFDEDIEVYVSNTNKALKLVVRGKVNSFQECPSAIATNNNGNLSFELQGILLSGQTHQTVPGAVVELIDAQKFDKIKLKTGKDGKFDKNIPIGLYIVHVDVPGYKLYEQNQYLNKNTAFLEINLTETGEKGLEWVARDDPEKEPKNEILKPDKEETKPFYQNGRIMTGNPLLPVARASVVLKSLQTQTPYFYKTLDDGKFKKLLLPGDYKLKVFADGYEPYEKTVTLSSPDSVLNLILTKSAIEEIPQKKKIVKKETVSGPVKISGTVINEENGLPVARASLILKNLETQTPYFYKTFKDGKFSKTLPTGKYMLHIEASGLASFDSSITITGEAEGLKFYTGSGNKQGIEVAEPQPARVKFEIKVADKEAGIPLENAAISMYSKQTDKLYRFNTSKDGTITQTTDTGLYAMSIKVPGFKPYFGKIRIKPDSDIPPFLLEKIQPDIVQVEIPERPDSTISKPVMKQVEKVKVDKLETELTPIDKDIFSPKIYLANNLVFLVDVSSSMNYYHKIENLKYAMTRLVTILRDIDMVTLITYSTHPAIVFSAMPANRKDSIFKMVDSMNPEGLTYGIRGLEKAYTIAEENFIPGGNNEVIIATDGGFNSPDYSEIQMVNMITRYALKDIKLTVIGFGKNEKALRTMKRMAIFGKGSFLHIQNRDEAESILIEEIKLNSQMH